MLAIRYSLPVVMVFTLVHRFPPGHANNLGSASGCSAPLKSVNRKQAMLIIGVRASCTKPDIEMLA
jgi:hypothetical protein